MEILRLVHNHRFMQAEHLHPLVFARATLRAVQQRLRKLWESEYLDRHFVPYALDGTRRPPSDASTPAYALGARGIEFLARACQAPEDVLAARAGGMELAPVTLAHHLIVTDLLASVEAAALGRASIGHVETEHEHWLWKKQARCQRSTSGLVVPDGVITFRGADRRLPETWYVEIVRAGVPGGNETFGFKMRRYLKLRESGLFRDAFRHVNVRGVLVAAPSPERARNLRALAAGLPSGRSFFGFTHFEERQGDRRVKRFRPETVLDLSWTDGAGAVFRLARPAERATSPPSAS